ncbi:MAG: hypothetical protein IIW10_01705, partial [Spirochaetaceae bacterium]|nr:hypothetical protein [Spirochaetaceae bacterium]
MPGFNQLEEFEKDLFSLGKEVSIRRDRGEKAVVSQLPTSTYVEDDSEDFADGWPQEPPSFKTRSTTPHLDLEEEATKIANASDEASSQDEDASESEIIISKPVKLSEEDFDDIIDNLSFDNLDVLPDWNDLPTEEFFTTADETAADETDEFSADSDEIGDDETDETAADESDEIS